MKAAPFGSSIIETSAWFDTDYSVCRQAFLNACEKNVHENYLKSYPVSGYPGLMTDTLWLGDQHASNVIVVISGTHGVEGYCGSAVQRFLLDCLQRDILSVPHDTAWLFIHALNPWGMQFGRRCDQEGIDLNRNFIDFNALPGSGPDYQSVLSCFEMDSALERRNALASLNSHWGRVRFDQAFSGGQYTHDWAPFFGGRAASTANKTLAEITSYWSLKGKTLIVLDVHSGLGPWAHGELISDHPVNSQGFRYAQTCFGPAVAQTAEGDSCSVPKQGLLDYFWYPLMQNSGCFVTLEFGTYGTDALFDVLLGEHMFWRAHPKIRSSQTSEHERATWRDAMIKHFCPEDQYWQQSVLFRAWQVMQCAQRGLDV